MRAIKRILKGEIIPNCPVWFALSKEFAFKNKNNITLHIKRAGQICDQDLWYVYELLDNSPEWGDYSL